MPDTTEQVVDTTASDANVADAAKPESSPGAVDTSDKSKAPPKDGPQKRIDELTWHRRQAERRSRALESENAELRSQLAQRQNPQPERQDSAALKKLADFEYDEEKYLDYLTDRAAERAVRKVSDSQVERQKADSRKETMTKFREREAAVRADLEDYEDVAYSAPIDGIEDIIMAMDEGPRIAYYLGKNPETAIRIKSLPPHLAAVELGRIDARLANEREQAKAKPVSKAPPPPPKIDATEPAIEKDPTQMTDKEFAKWRKQFMNKR